MIKQPLGQKLNYGAKIPTSTAYVKNFVEQTDKISFRGQGTLTSFIKTTIQSNYSGSYVKNFNNN